MANNNLKDHYILKDGKKLYYGYTTGTCAAAAAKAAAYILFLKEEIKEVHINTPFGISLYLPVHNITKGKDFVRCAIQKDAGDDPDVTNGIFIYVTVTKEDSFSEGQVEIQGGAGVGRITQPGLDQPVGSAAINHVPREMIEKELQGILAESSYTAGVRVLIEVPEGEILAKKTCNPRLGIEGGISILGTTGIVVPMSEEALLGSIEAEMKMHLAKGETHLFVSPGNYGETFLRQHPELGTKKSILCSNYVGKTLDLAAALGVEHITFVAHIGKFIKVAGGIMDTHSKSADCRAELMAACAIKAGADIEMAKAILDTVTTEESVRIIKEAGLLSDTMEIVVQKVWEHLKRRCDGKIAIDVILFSSVEGKLGAIYDR